MDAQERRRIIVEFVSNHHGCKAEDVYDGVKEQISRVPACNTLQQLVKDGVIGDQKPNRREHRYSVENNNPLVSVPRELDEFEKLFYNFLEGARIKYNEMGFRRTRAKAGESKMVDYSVDIQIHAGQILKQVLNTYLSYALIKWPIIIQDKELLAKVYTIVFDRLQQITLEFTQFVPFMRLYQDNELNLQSGRLGLVHGLDEREISEIYAFSKQSGLEREFEPLMGFIWKIRLHTEDIIPTNIQKEPDWRKVLEDVS